MARPNRLRNGRGPVPRGPGPDDPPAPDQPRDRWAKYRQVAPERRGQGCGPRFTHEQVKEALEKSHGNVKFAAARLACSRQSIYQRILNAPELQKLQAELLEERLDEYEAAVDFLAVEELHPTALLAMLNAKGRARGWAGQRSDLMHSNGTNISAGPVGGDTHYHLHLYASGGRLSEINDDELARLIDERRAALPAPDADELPPAVEIIPPSRKQSPTES